MTVGDIAWARPATDTDIATIVELAEIVLAELSPERGGMLMLFHDMGSVGDRARYVERLQDHRAMLAIGAVDGVVVGYGSAGIVESATARVCMIDELVVHPQARGIGVGAEILRAVSDWAIAGGCSTIESQVLPGNRAAKNFFERVGMVTRKMQVSAPLS